MGKTSKELEKKLAELQAASVEAGVEFKRIYAVSYNHLTLPTKREG